MNGNNKITCKYRSSDGRELTIEGDSNDKDFMDECHKLTGREPKNFQGRQYYPYYNYYNTPYYYGGTPYQYYYYPYYPFYGSGFYGGYRRSCWGGFGGC